LLEDKEGRRKLSHLLLICFDSLDIFGKEPDQLENISHAFQLVLAEYDYSKIEKAFKIYMTEETVMPKPADIIKLIDKLDKKAAYDRSYPIQQRSLKKLRLKYNKIQ